MNRATKIVVIVVCVLVAAIVAALAGMIAFGTGDPPAALASLGEPFRRVDFSDLPPVEKLPVRSGSPIAFRVWGEKPSSDPELVVIAIHGSSSMSASLHPIGKALGAAGIPVYAPDIRGHGGTGTRGDIDYAGRTRRRLRRFRRRGARQTPEREARADRLLFRRRLCAPRRGDPARQNRLCAR